MKDHLFDHPGSKSKRFTPCPSKIRWSVEGLEKDLYIKTPTVTILAMDGRRRWLDIKELVRHGLFVCVTYSNFVSFGYEGRIQVMFYL